MDLRQHIIKINGWFHARYLDEQVSRPSRSNPRPPWGLFVEFIYKTRFSVLSNKPKRNSYATLTRLSPTTEIYLFEWTHE